MAVHRGRGSVRAPVAGRVIANGTRPPTTRARIARGTTSVAAVRRVARIGAGQTDATVSGQSFLKRGRVGIDRDVAD